MYCKVGLEVLNTDSVKGLRSNVTRYVVLQ